MLFRSTPWEKRYDTQSTDPTLKNQPWHTSPDGLRDVAAIGVAIAVIDPRSKVLVTDAQLETLAGAMNDFTSGMKRGALLSQIELHHLLRVVP